MAKMKQTTLTDNEKRQINAQQLVKRALTRITSFTKPIEEKFTGLGLPVLFSWLACRSGDGIVCTAPMGAGKTAAAEFVAELMTQSEFADHVFNLQEFKKTDWKAILPAHAEEEFFHFSVPEISAMNEYSQELFWSKIPVLQSDGTFVYIYPAADGDEKGGKIEYIRCEASYFIASQPPKTDKIVNDTTFRTLANDRCWNIILLNQLRGRSNVKLDKISGIVSSLNLSSGCFTHLIRKVPKNAPKEGFPADWIRFKKTSEVKRKDKKTKKMVKVILVEEYHRIPTIYVKFHNGTDVVSHLTQSSLDVEELEDCIRNQYSVDRREEKMHTILREFVSFLDEDTVEQVHVDLFVQLFGFYIKLFNRLTIGSVEQSISIRYGAVEMLCKISSLIARGKLITQELLTKEFNAVVEDVAAHIEDLLAHNIIKLRKLPPISRKKGSKRYEKKKSPQMIRRQAKTLMSVGLLSKRFANAADIMDDDNVRPRMVIYEFTDEINSFFKLYALILSELLPKKLLKTIKHIEKFLPLLNEEEDS